MKIKFTSDHEGFPEPYPAAKNTPTWYKELPQVIGQSAKCPMRFSGDKPSFTIKPCAPFSDALTAGYIIPLPVDVMVEQVKQEDGTNRPMVRFSGMDAFSMHSAEQIGDMPVNCKHYQGKWHNPWVITTPKGYSCEFKQPEYRTLQDGTPLPFRLHTGRVDTDEYYNEVNLPFDWIDTDFEGVIPAGTPMVQVIPYKRVPFKMTIGRTNGAKRDITKFKLMSKLFDAYKSQWWKKKVWR